jgi:leishmanolysin
MKFLILFISIIIASPHCIHEKLDHHIEYLNPPELQTTHMAFPSTNYSPIRIHLDFTYLVNVTSDMEYYLKGLAYASTNFFKAALSVQPITGRLTIPVSTVCNLKTPSLYMSQGVDADLIIFVRAVYDNDTYVAAARACMLISTNSRPAVGELFFNTRIVKAGGNLDYQRHTLTTLHEMTHVLGFSSGLFDSYINPETNRKLTGHIKVKNVNGLNTTYLDIFPLTNIVREYFNCQSIEGAPLENEGRVGSIGSHWERKVFMNEYMTASDIADSKISIITLGLLEGTGWYKPEYTMADNFYWGNGKGCGFLTQPCMNKQTQKPNFDEFCQPLTQQGCTYTGRGIGFCGSPVPFENPDLPSNIDYWGNKSIVYDSFADNCPYYIQYSNADCENSTHSKIAKLPEESFGKGSKCFSGNIFSGAPLPKQVGYCLKYHCELVNSDAWLLVIELGYKTVKCYNKGAAPVSGYQGTINCPDPYAYCTTVGKKVCPRGCMGKGTCEVNGTCVCGAGWEGDDCGISKNLKPGGSVGGGDDGEVPTPKPVPDVQGSKFFAIIIGAGLVFGIFICIRNKKRREQENIDDVELMAYNRAS